MRRGSAGPETWLHMAGRKAGRSYFASALVPAGVSAGSGAGGLLDDAGPDPAGLVGYPCRTLSRVSAANAAGGISPISPRITTEAQWQPKTAGM